ncbi:MAG: hypothetical protein R2754_13905 [Microthrixaceae bacterium]
MSEKMDIDGSAIEDLSRRTRLEVVGLNVERVSVRVGDLGQNMRLQLLEASKALQERSGSQALSATG